jgi:hypothetical protein
VPSKQNEQEQGLLKELQQIAVARAKQTGDIGDVEKAIGIMKSITDREKTARDNRDERSLMRNEWLKSERWWQAASLMPELKPPLGAGCTLEKTCQQDWKRQGADENIRRNGYRISGCKNPNQDTDWLWTDWMDGECGWIP